MPRPRHPNSRGPDPGSTYLDLLASRLGLEGLAPSEIHEELGQVEGLRLGPTKSALGGRVTNDLHHLSPDEFQSRAAEAEEFLKRERVSYPADESVTDSR
jgi:hypothetical protein